VNVFTSHMSPRLQELSLSADARAGVERELPKMAGAELNSISQLTTPQRAELHASIDASFTAAFRVAMVGAAALALGAALIGSRIRGVVHD